jgi:bifunctional DNA-binding transcriptional regulator/antitoxin component of YhaV-PrlF toxin-antitoxin module
MQVQIEMDKSIKELIEEAKIANPEKAGKTNRINERRDLSVTRRLDQLGRVCVPKQLKQRLGWENGDSIRFSDMGNGVIGLSKDVGETAMEALQVFQHKMTTKEDMTKAQQDKIQKLIHEMKTVMENI